MDDALRERSEAMAATVKDDLRGVRYKTALVHAIEALRLAVLAAASPDDPEEVYVEEATWARVELFGHSVRVGLAREVDRFGHRWIEVLQPALWREPPGDAARDAPDLPGTVKLFHPNAVYALQEYDDPAEGEQAYRASRGVYWPGDEREAF